MVVEAHDPQAFGPADASDTVTSQHASPKGIWSEEFRPCWYLVSIPGVMIVGTLIVVGVRKLARNYLIKNTNPDDPPAVVVEDFETGQVSHRTSISMASQPSMAVNLARRISVAPLDAIGHLGQNQNLDQDENLLEKYSLPSRPAKAFNACRRTSCIEL